jgi:hypothetical protein
MAANGKTRPWDLRDNGLSGIDSLVNKTKYKTFSAAQWEQNKSWCLV